MVKGEQMSTEKTVWATLNEIDVKPYIKKKGNLDYLPWSSAIGLVKPYYPDMRQKVYKNELGWNYHTDGVSCWVEVGVTINNNEEMEYLPVMDYQNKAIPKEKVTSVDVNKAIKRATVKALAHHGLAISLYSGEELPSETQEEIKYKSYKTFSKASDDDRKDYKVEFMNKCEEFDVSRGDIVDFFNFLGVDHTDEKEKHNSIVQFLRSPDNFENQLESYKLYKHKQISS